MVKKVIEDTDHAATHDGKKYPLPLAPAMNIPLYRGRGVPASEEKTTPGVSEHNEITCIGEHCLTSKITLFLHSHIDYNKDIAPTLI